jgi:hypothetical protein
MARPPRMLRKPSWTDREAARPRALRVPGPADRLGRSRHLAATMTSLHRGHRLAGHSRHTRRCRASCSQTGVVGLHSPSLAHRHPLSRRRWSEGTVKVSDRHCGGVERPHAVLFRPPPVEVARPAPLLSLAAAFGGDSVADLRSLKRLVRSFLTASRRAPANPTSNARLGLVFPMSENCGGPVEPAL